MPHKYPPDQKTVALILLERNLRDFSRTSQQTGISRSTLHAWDSDIQAYIQETPTLVRQPAELPVFENDMDALAFIRQNILAELSRLSASLKDDPGFSTPYQRALVMSQLMDKLLKLDLHLKPYTPREQQKIRIEFVDEQGNVHDSLPYTDDEDDMEYAYDNLWHGDDAAADNPPA
ncbi:MAG: hypothetical protein ABI690_28850 [Chloroflexota bacterium]